MNPANIHSKNTCLVLSILALLQFGWGATSGSIAGEVTTYPVADRSNNIIIGQDGSVTFTATPDTGSVSVSLTVSPSGATISGGAGWMTATFPEASAGQENVCTFAVTHTSGTTTCTDDKTFTYNVWVPQFEPFGTGADGTGSDVWFFSGASGENFDSNSTMYATTIYGDIDGLPPNTTSKWTIGGQHNVVNFENNQETITSTATEHAITSCGFSSHESNLSITLSVNGNDVAWSDDFTARSPANITPSANTYYQTNTWTTIFSYKVADKFGDELLDLVTFCETFTGTKWSIGTDYPSENWSSRGRHFGFGWVSNGSSIFTDSNTLLQIPEGFVNDHYTPGPVAGLSPAPVESRAARGLIMYQGQQYLVGGDEVIPNDGTPPTSATGFTIDSFTLRFHIGYADHR